MQIYLRYLFILSILLIASCDSEKPKSGKEINFEIDESGALWMEGQQLETPLRQSQINNILGTPSKELKYGIGPRFYFWDHLGIMTSAFSDTAVVAIQLYMYGKPKYTEKYPRNRFVGNIEIPEGTIDLDSELEVSNFGFSVYFDNVSYSYRKIFPNGLALIFYGPKPNYDKPGKLVITFNP